MSYFSKTNQKYKIIFEFGLWITLIIIITDITLQYVDSILIFGGQKCEQANGIQSCVGYVPAGIMVIVLVSFVAAAFISHILFNHEF